MRRYACMALTNLTFGDGTNKALLCSMKSSMRALVSQLQSPNEDLRQVAASVLRNLSWRADLASKKTLREVGSVTALMTAAMEVKKESTLKSILSALWNLSAHCSENKADICGVEGALAFLVGTLTYKSPSKTLAIIENGGGILRNISSHIAVREDYRETLRQHLCLQMLLKHLKSPSLTIVSNACGTLWNLSARCQDDQQALWDLGAVSMLRNLVHSKHKMISMGSAAALKNLISARPALANLESDRYKSNKPGLHVRKQRALEAELDQNLAETCDNMESPQDSPTETRKSDQRGRSKFPYSMETSGLVYPGGAETEPRRPLLRGSFYRGHNGDCSPHSDDRILSPQRSVSRSASQDSVGSTHSDISHDRSRAHSMLAKSTKLLQDRKTIYDRQKTTDKHGNETSGSVDSSIDQSDKVNSRLMQVMHEVARNAGLESGPLNLKDPSLLREVHSAECTPPVGRRQMERRIPLLQGGNTNIVSQGQAATQAKSLSQSIDNSDINFQNISQRLENLHFDIHEPEQDTPINYSTKYAELHLAAQRASEAANAQQPAKGPVSRSQNSAFIKPAPRTGNNVQRQAPKQVAEVPPSSKIPVTGKKSAHPKFQYPQEDVDLSTNYSLKFSEKVEEDDVLQEQPIDFSQQFKEQESCNERIDLMEQTLTEDTVQTFHTEGTPLNFSTATSMNDLTDKHSQMVKHVRQPRPLPPEHHEVHEPGDEIQNFSSKYLEAEHLSHTGTDQNSASTVVKNQKESTPREHTKYAGVHVPVSNCSPPSLDSQPPSIYSYNDSSGGVSSPSDKPTQYCTEGTPTCFSRVSSLSSLHSGEADETESSHPSKSDGLESIDENSSLDTTQNKTLKGNCHDNSFPSADTSLSHADSSTGHTKSVTFDQNNHVQETPLMFSRCSSLGSLSSFDAPSVHSSVVSEYSRRASEVVSPSELPDSPSDTMPPSPSHPKSPVQFVTGLRQDVTNHPRGQIPGSKSRPVHRDEGFTDLVRNFQEEGSPEDGFSCATSLSALTIDDEPKIRKEKGLEKVLPGQEESSSNDNDTTYSHNSAHDITVIERKTEDKPNDLDEASSSNRKDDSSSDSEDNEDLLAECISLGMPTKSQKKITRSSSDNILKRKMHSSHTQKSKLPSKITESHSSGYLSAITRPLPSTMQSLHRSYHVEDDYGHDMPRCFDTEGTPLNFSTTGSLSDISLDSATGDCVEHDDIGDKTMTQPAPVTLGDNDVDGNSDFSFSDDDDLLSEVIEAAMPKSKTTTKKTSQTEQIAGGAESRTKTSYNQPAPRNPPPHMSFKQSADPTARSSDLHDVTDCIKTYAVEGTPLNFSRATSLSDLTDLESLQKEEIEHVIKDNPSDITDEMIPCFPDEGVNDSPRVYGMEGTPMSFSRDDSLSPLMFESDEIPKYRHDEYSNRHDETPKDKGKAQRQPLQSPAITRLKTPGKQMRSHEPNHHSTPIAHKPESKPMLSAIDDHDDQLRTFAVEGTPNCFSRNSSLSSLNSDDHEALANNSGGSDPTISEPTRDESVTFKVEDTPANISGESSLSALSVESLSFEPTPSENALLEECINAGMPKNTRKKRKDSHSKGASGSSEGATKKSPKAESLPVKHLENWESDLTTNKHSKNVEGPQADIEKVQEITLGKNLVGTTAMVENTLLLKKQKEANNQEKLHCHGQTTTSADQDTDRTISKPQGNNAVMAIRAEAACLPPDSLLTYSLTGSLEIDENKLAEEAEQLSQKFAELSMQTSSTSEKDICLEAEVDVDFIEKEKSDKTKTEKSGASCQLFKDQASSSDSLGCQPLESSSNSELTDIMKESFPEMSSSLVSDVTPGDITSPEDDAAQKQMLESDCTTDDSKLEKTLVQRQPDKSGANNDDSLLEGDSANFDEELSLDEERLLAESANFIVSELSMTQELSLETLDDDLFLENETISLISDFDAASEVSVSASQCSSLDSEPASEVSSSSQSQISTVPSVVTPVRKFARIVKPLNREVVKQQQQQKEEKETVPKGIRGGGRGKIAGRGRGRGTTRTPPSIKPGIGAAKSSPQSSNQSKIMSKKPVVTPPSKPVVLSKKTPPKTPPKTSTLSSRNGSKIEQPTGITQKSVHPTRTTAQKSATSITPPRNISNQTSRVTPPKLSSFAPKVSRPTNSTGSTQSRLTPPNTKVNGSSNSSQYSKINGNASSPRASPKLTKVSPPTRPSPQTKPSPPLKPSPPSKLPAPRSFSGIPRSTPPKPSTAPKPSPPSIATTLPCSDTTFYLEEPERPKPPIKQGTFTMDSPTQPTPDVSAKNSPLSTDLNGNKMAKEASKESLAPSVKSSSSGGGGFASPIFDGAWTSTIPGPDVDKVCEQPIVRRPQVHGGRVPIETKMKSASLNTRREASPGRMSARARSAGSESSLNKTSSSGSLNKSFGRTKPGITRSSSLQKSDSQSSLKKNGNRSTTPTSRSTTPTSRKTSSGSISGGSVTVSQAGTSVISPPRKPLPPTPSGKKPAVSKIASLWRKESTKVSDNGQSKDNITKPKTKSVRKPQPSVTANGDVAKMVSLTRSSTYDKIDTGLTVPPSTGEIKIGGGDACGDDEMKPPQVPPRTAWRRTYTVEDEEDKQLQAVSVDSVAMESDGIDMAGSMTESACSISSHGVTKQQSVESIRSSSSELNQDVVESEKKDGKKDGSKKRFTWWRRDSDKSEKKKTKGSKAVAKADGSTVKKTTSWLKRDKHSSETPVEKFTNGQAVMGTDDTSLSAQLPPQSPLTSPTRSQQPNAAIVTPFNYKPNASPPQEFVLDKVTPQAISSESSIPSPTKPATKTEMLLARRRRQSYMNSLNKPDEAVEDSEEGKKTPCLVTTV